MTLEERQQNLSVELRAVIKWANEESEKVYNRLKSEGATLGLDSHPEEFAPINEEYKRRWREIIEKYRDLPPDTKLKL